MNTTSDATKWQAVGFTLKSQAVPLGPLGQVLNLVVTAGDNEGTLDVSWDRCGARKVTRCRPARSR